MLDIGRAIMGRRKRKGRRGEGPEEGSREMKRTIFIAVVLLLVLAAAVTLVVVARMQGGGGVLDPGTDPNANDDSPPGTQIFDFTVTDIDGNAFTLSAQTKTLVLVDLFATWCGPCESQLSELKGAVSALGAGKLQVISIDVDLKETVSDLREYRTGHGITWPVAQDTAGLSDRYGVASIPTLLLYDQDGRVLKKWVGTTHSSDIVAECNKHL